MSQRADLVRRGCSARRARPRRAGARAPTALQASIDERAAVVEAAATRTGAGRRGAARDAGERARLAQVRDRVEQRPGVGVRGVLEHRVPRAQLDDLAGVHHRHPVGDVGHDGEVVGDVEGADPVGAAELGHRLEDHRLRGHVETGRRLVEHQHLGLGQERHGQRDALHLAARQLVGVAAEELVVAGQAHLGQAVARALQPRLRRADVAQLQQLDDLLADPDGRVERRRRVLRHVGDLLAADLAHLLPRHAEHVAALEEHLAGGDERARPRVVRAARCPRSSCRSPTRPPGRRPRRA